MHETSTLYYTVFFYIIPFTYSSMQDAIASTLSNTGYKHNLMCTLSYTACEHTLLRSRQAHSPVHHFHIKKNLPKTFLALETPAAKSFLYTYTELSYFKREADKPLWSLCSCHLCSCKREAPEGEEYDFFFLAVHLCLQCNCFFCTVTSKTIGEKRPGMDN